MSDFYLDGKGNKTSLGPGSVACVLANQPTAVPIRHRKYGLGWKCDQIGVTYFLSNPDMLQQEILAVEQRAKLRKQKQQNKGQK